MRSKHLLLEEAALRLHRCDVPAGSATLGSQAQTVPDPDREAAIWYFQAASAGHADAQYHLGLLFLAGKGVIDSRTESARWMRKAAAQGHLEAKKALNIIESGK